MSYPRVEYEMTQADLDEILDACRPTPVMMIGGFIPNSPQENANRAWAALGRKMGFDSVTVQPVSGKGMRFFTAVPSENETQRAEREKREAELHRVAEIERLNKEIDERVKAREALKDAALRQERAP